MIIYYEKPSWVSDIDAWNIACHEVASLLGECISYSMKADNSIKADNLLLALESLSFNTDSAWMTIYERINKNETSD